MHAPLEGGGQIKLDPRLDAGLVQRVFRQSGRVHIGAVLAPECALRIHRSLLEETPWRMAICDEQGHRDLPVATLDELDPDERARLVSSIDRVASHGFAYRYSNFRIDEQFQSGNHRPPVLMSLYEFLNSPAFLDFARRATGFADISFADAQATLYRPGDFLTGHDDDVAGKNRRAAYVLNFTPQWRIEWGGLLAFPDAHGHLHEAYGPSFNALNLLRVPTLHLVTQVASFAGGERYSITGWLRSS